MPAELTRGEQVCVLLIDDDEDDYVITRRLLKQGGAQQYVLEWTPSYEEGLEAVMRGACDVALVDYRLGVHSGLDLIRAACEHGAPTPIILLTGQGDPAVDRQAVAAGAADYLVKGEVNAPLLERSIRYALGRRRAEERIRAQAALLDKASDAICAFGMDRRVSYWNRSAEQLTGYAAHEVRQMAAAEMIGRIYAASGEKMARVRRQVIERGEWRGELRQRTKGGEERVVENRWSLVRDAAGQPQSILIIGTDVSERKQLETQFLRAQRMESIGRLVGGIAHDLGNLLVPVLLGAEVLKNHLPADERTQRTLQMIEKSAQRGSEMVKQVLSFARGVEGERALLEVPSILQEVEHVALDTFPDAIKVAVTAAEDLWPIYGDATQVQQVLVNLCVNARDAMPGGGALRVEAANVALGERQAARSVEAHPGRYVCITVADTGTGIDPEDLDKVFEPFFTTKGHSEGTGLGLSTVYSIVKSHRGFVEMESRPGRGTSFAVHWPVAEEEDAGPAAGAEEASAEEAGHGATVLVIDDEAFIVASVRGALEHAGYEVLTASGSDEAWALFQEHQDAIDAVVADLLLSGASSLGLIRRIRAERAHVPILVASSPGDGQGIRALRAGANRFLPKPYTAEMLRAALRHVLRPHASEAAT